MRSADPGDRRPAPSFLRWILAEPRRPPRAGELHATIVPIRQTVLSSGSVRYSVRLRLGSTILEAGLDTGSTGLRVLSRSLNFGEIEAGDAHISQAYSAGIRLDGVTGYGLLEIGNLGPKGDIPFHIVRSVTRLKDRPRGPAGEIPINEYGLQGDTLAGEGFDAILGLNLASGNVPNPLVALGVERWIIDLPLTGQGRKGRLILNPSAHSIRRFVRIPFDPEFSGVTSGMHDAIAGCLENIASGDVISGPALLDTGAPGINVVGLPSEPTRWPNGDRAHLSLGDEAGGVSIKFSVGRRAHASRLHFSRQGMPTPRLIVGTLPYLACRVLYDASARQIGFKRRFIRPSGMGVKVYFGSEK